LVTTSVVMYYLYWLSAIALLGGYKYTYIQVLPHRMVLLIYAAITTFIVFQTIGDYMYCMLIVLHK